MAALGLADHEVTGVGARMPVHAAPAVAVLVGANTPQVSGERRSWWPLTLLRCEHLAQLRTPLARLRRNIHRTREPEDLIARRPQQAQGRGSRDADGDRRDDAPPGRHDDEACRDLPCEQQRRSSDRPRGASHRSIPHHVELHGGAGDCISGGPFTDEREPRRRKRRGEQAEKQQTGNHRAHGLHPTGTARVRHAGPDQQQDHRACHRSDGALGECQVTDTLSRGRRTARSACRRNTPAGAPFHQGLGDATRSRIASTAAIPASKAPTGAASVTKR